MKQSIVRKAFKDTIPVMSGYLVLGIGFGVVLASRGYGVLWAMAMSVFIFAGSMQYVAIDLITGGATLITTALTTLAVNARHLFYGLSMIEKYKGVRKKPFLIFTLTDETYSLVVNDAGTTGIEEKDSYYFWVSLLDYSYWVSGSVLGSLIGAMIPFDMTGIDFSLTALFLTVFVEQWLSTKNHLAAITGVIASVVCLMMFGADNFLIPTMILITFALMMMRGKEGITNE